MSYDIERNLIEVRSKDSLDALSEKLIKIKGEYNTILHETRIMYDTEAVDSDVEKLVSSLPLILEYKDTYSRLKILLVNMYQSFNSMESDNFAARL